MSEQIKLTPELHKKFVQDYIAVKPVFEKYATVLKRVLLNAREASLPTADVQSRPKEVSSFAEKCARKFQNYYPDPVKKMNDLCGARVIVQTQEQVEAVKQFVEANFKYLERDEKGVQLGEEKFGYRDMHYIIQLRPDKCGVLGITNDELAEIGGRKAELQVRTWLQHAWADTLHDRVYKCPLKLPSEVKRTGNLLAALMEEGDRNYDTLVHELDEMLAHYASHATTDKVQAEMAVQELILENEADQRKKARLALQLARLHAACGNYAKVVDLLSPYVTTKDADLRELSQDLGHALCRENRGQPSSDEYQRGVKLLRQSLALYASKECSLVPNVRRDASLHARATARLARALEALSGREQREAVDFWRQAHDLAPSNPYILANLLGYLAYLDKNFKQAQTMQTNVRQGIQTCLSHAKLGTELPQAYFAAGRLALLNRENEAVGYYARGIRHCLEGTHCFPPDLFEEEIAWLSRLFILEKQDLPAMVQWILDLFELARDLPGGRPVIPPKAIIVAGGATSMNQEDIDRIRPFVESILRGFKGRVVSGGTKVGVPGCVGDVVESLGKENAGLELVGYIPSRLPPDAPMDHRYHVTKCDEPHFSPEQILRMWKDFKRDGIAPHEVVCVGFGGGPISAFEYQIALALGACVVVVQGTKGSADEIAKDPVWKGLSNLFPVPLDGASFKFLLTASPMDVAGPAVEEIARELHARYLANSSGRFPENLRPWDHLGESYKKANCEQARHAVAILRAVGFEVRPSDNPVIFKGFTEGNGSEVERMAELEHGRWNVERIRDGWRLGPVKDEQKKIHPCLVPWDVLSDGPDGMKKYDRDAVMLFPKILAKAGLEVFRK